MCIQTGHTLRLLSFPDFLDSFLQKVITIKKKLDGAINAAKTLFGIANFASGEAGKVLQRDRDTTEIETNIRKTRAGGLVLAVLCARTRTILSATDRKRVYACRTTSKTQLRRWRGRAQRQSSSSSSSATLNAPRSLLVRPELTSSQLWHHIHLVDSYLETFLQLLHVLPGFCWC